MTNLYSQLVSVIGTPPNEMIQYLYYCICAFIVFMSIKLLFTFIFRFVLNIKK